MGYRSRSDSSRLSATYLAFYSSSRSKAELGYLGGFPGTGLARYDDYLVFKDRIYYFVFFGSNGKAIIIGRPGQVVFSPQPFLNGTPSGAAHGEKGVPRTRLELVTPGFSVQCSTN